MFYPTQSSSFKILYCIKCELNFMSDYGKAKHDSKFHKSHNKTKCLVCQKSYYQILNHISNRHARTLKQKECKLCGEMFQSDKERRRHLKVHPKVRKYYRVCNFCGKHFKYYYNAMDHACTR